MPFPIVACLLSLFLLDSNAAGPRQDPAADLPSADVLFRRHVDAIGGADAIRRVKTRRRSGTLSVDLGGHTFSCDVDEHSLAPGKRHLLLDGAALSRVMVTDGTHAWEWRPQAASAAESGGDGEGEATRLLDGDKARRFLDTSRLHGALEWKQRFASLRTVKVAPVLDRPAYLVLAKDADERETELYFDRLTGRLVRTVTTFQDPHLGKTHAVTDHKDHIDVDGVWEPRTVQLTLDTEAHGKGTQTWTYRKIEHGVEVAPERFAMPVEVRELVRAQERDTRGED